MYKRFKEEMVMEGILRWRHHDESLDICVMTDYNPLNGNIVPGSFVHVTKLHFIWMWHIQAFERNRIGEWSGYASRNYFGHKNDMHALPLFWWRDVRCNRNDWMWKYKFAMGIEFCQHIFAVHEWYNSTYWQCSY